MSETSENQSSESIFDSGSTDAGDAATTESPDFAAELEAAVAEAARSRDAYLRALADFENYRRRSVRDREDDRARAVGALVEDLLPVLDGLRLAADSAGDGPDASRLAEGVSMISVRFAETLARQGVERIEPGAGAHFDPHVHEAVSHVASATVPEGSIVKVVRPGYRVGRRLVRAASVVVSSGNPEAGS